MKKEKNGINLSNICVGVAFLIVYIFLVALIFIDNGNFKNEIMNNNYEILEYTVTSKKDYYSPTGVVNVYDIDIGGIKNDEVNIAFYTSHQYSKVYVGDELVCSITPSEEYNFTKTVGSNWVMFKIKKEEMNKQVKVILTPVYDDVVSPDIQFIKGSSFSIFYKIFVDNMPQIILGFIAMIIGLLFIIVAFCRKVLNKECFTIFMLGLISLLLGTWRLFDSQLLPFMFSKKPLFLYFTIVTILTLAPIPFLYVMRSEADKVWKNIYDLICIIVSVVAVTQIFLQVVYKIDVREYLSIYHNFLFVCIFILLISEVYHKVKGFKRINVVQDYLPLICIIAVILDLVVYFYTKNTKKTFFTVSLFLIYICVSGLLLLREYAVREKTLKEELKQSQIAILLSQIQPHFIYNTLSSIRYLCKNDTDLAQQSIDDFSVYLRCNMDSLQNNDLILFEKELMFIEKYVKLEQLRFGEKINMIYDIQEKDFYVPSLTIQPLVENAIKHGITVKEEGGTVVLQTKRVDNNIIISIIDDGVGFEVEGKRDESKTHIGLSNVKNRLNYLVDANMEIKSSDKGTNIQIILKNVKKGKAE